MDLDEEPYNQSQSLDDSVNYLAGALLDDKHYGILHQTLSSKWDRYRSLNTAMKLMEQYGVILTPEEEETLGNMDEADMIDDLVGRMPTQSKEQFQHFFLQLQLIVSTATRVRQALEEGRPDEVEEALNDADATGISQYIMKMAIIQAGSEVVSLQQQHKAFVKDSEGKLGKMVRGQEDALQAKRKLRDAQNQLNFYHSNARGGATKFLLSYNTTTDSVLAKVMFNAWLAALRHQKMERDVFELYRERLMKAEKALSRAQSGHLSNAHNFLSRKFAAMHAALLSECMEAFRKTVERAQAERQHQRELDLIAARLQSFADEAAENAKKVMARMGASSEQGLIAVCFQGWMSCLEESKKEKKLAADEAEGKKRAEELLKTQSLNAKSIMATMAGASDTGLVYGTFNAWKAVRDDATKAAELAKVVESGKSKLAAFAGRNKPRAMSAMEKAMYQQDLVVVLKCYAAWRLDTRMERLSKANQVHIGAKKEQLSKVQTMFKNFATQLETDLKVGLTEGSEREVFQRASSQTRSRKGLTKSDGTVSLPDIHASQKPSRGYPAEEMRAPAPTQAWH